jgi:hypothetical protein
MPAIDPDKLAAQAKPSRRGRDEGPLTGEVREALEAFSSGKAEAWKLRSTGRRQAVQARIGKLSRDYGVERRVSTVPLKDGHIGLVLNPKRRPRRGRGQKASR